MYSSDDLKIVKQQSTLVDLVEDKLLDYFNKMEVKPGDPIPKETELAEALGVGRSVLREALSRLRMLGLVETRTKRGMILTEPSLLKGIRRVVEPRILSDDALFDLLGFRVALEIGICDLVINNLTEGYLQELETIVNRGVVYNHGEYSPVSEYEFHTKLYEITGNKTIIEFQEVIRPVSVFLKEKFKDYFLPVNLEIEKKGKRITHNDLLELLKSRDREGFRKAMVDHFTPYYGFLRNKCSLQNSVH